MVASSVTDAWASPTEALVRLASATVSVDGLEMQPDLPGQCCHHEIE